MICNSKQQAERVALIGASKMAGQNYQAVQSPMNPNVWKCIKSDGTWYRVEIGKMPRRCSCAFYRENCQIIATCKHIVYIEAEAEAQYFCQTLATASNALVACAA